MDTQETSTPTGKREKMSRLRLLIAERMYQSSQATAPVTLSTEVDATEIVAFRTQAKAQGSGASTPSYNAMFMKAVANALPNHPQLNGSIDGKELVLWEEANIGIAIDTPRGLVVPVVRNVQDKSVAALSAEIEALILDAGQGKLLPDQFQGGTFTITSLGMYDVDFFTPIINYPQVGILGIGRIKQTLSMQAGKITEGAKVFLSLTFDHRAVDGAPAARFLKEVAQWIEQPAGWLTADP